MLKDEAARTELLAGAKFIYDSVTATYGPKGANVLVEKSFGFPMLTRDGVTVARETYLSDRAKNMGAQLLLQASEQTNRVAGDGTTATVALAYHLLSRGVKAISAGQHPMEVKARILADSELLADKLKTLSKSVKTSQLKEVATVSTGDPLIGQMIAEAVEYVGESGGINVEKSPISSIERVYMDGYYIQSGFEALQTGRKELNNPFTVVVQRRITTHGDAITLLNNTFESLKAAGAIKQGEIMPIVLIGNVEEQAYLTISNMIAQGLLDGIIVKSPLSYGDMGRRLLEDIAIYAGCDPIIETTNLRELTLEFVGRGLERVVASKSDTTLFGIDAQSEAVADRITHLKSQIKAEEVDAIKERLQDRLAKLEGKIAIFRIGGATGTAREETEFRVEDGILATRAAARHGVVPGGGVTLLELSKVKGVSELTRNALEDVFKQLLINANLPAELKLAEVLQAEQGYGYNLRAGDELTDMVKAGVLDPTLVVEQVCRNACEIAANLLTTGTVLTFETATEAGK